MNEDSLKLDNQLCFPLYASARKAVAAYTPYLKPLGLTYTQYIVLMVLWEEDSITVGRIGERLKLDNGTLTPLLKKMETIGYIKRSRSSEDERQVIVTLTSKGRDIKYKVSDIPERVGSCIDLEPKEAETLYYLLYKIIGV